MTGPAATAEDIRAAGLAYREYTMGSHLQFFDDGTTAIAIPTEDGDAYEFFTLDEGAEAVRQEILAELEDEARAMMYEEKIAEPPEHGQAAAPSA
jgi:hypothetical protein